MITESSLVKEIPSRVNLNSVTRTVSVPTIILSPDSVQKNSNSNRLAIVLSLVKHDDEAIKKDIKIRGSAFFILQYCLVDTYVSIKRIFSI